LRRNGVVEEAVETPEWRESERVLRGAPPYHLIVLGILVGLAVIRGLFWLVTVPIPFGDEPSHYSYIQWMATGRGIPVTGRDHVTGAALELAKSSAVQPWRAVPQPPDPRLGWGLLGQQYEGFQPPGYYILMVPAYWLGRATDGLLGSIYAVRLATLMLIAASVPLIYLLAREMFPRRPAVWLLSPAVVVGIQLINSAAYLANDSVTGTAAAATLLVVLRARNDLRPRRAFLCGLSVGLLLLLKTTAIALVPALAIAMAWYLWVHRPPLRTTLWWFASAALGGLVVILPWLAFNLHAYGALSGGKAQAAIVVPVIGRMRPGWAGVQLMMSHVVHSLFIVPTSAKDSVLLQHGWYVTGSICAGAGILGAAIARYWDELLVVLWLLVSLPLGLLLLAVSVLSESGPGASLTARHLDVLVPLFAIMVGYGAVALIGSRLGAAALLSWLVAASFLEKAADRQFVANYYTFGIIGHSVPVVTQTYADALGEVQDVRATTPCPPTAVALDLYGPLPAVRVDNRPVLYYTRVRGWTVFTTGSDPSGPVDILLPTRAPIGVATNARSPQIREEGGATPAVEIYCSVSHPAGHRFVSLYRPDHNFPMTLRVIDDWPLAESLIEAVLLGGCVLAMLLTKARPR
jgi:hypothetical protein